MYKLKLSRSVGLDDLFLIRLREVVEEGFDCIDYDITPYWPQQDLQTLVYDAFLQKGYDMIKSNGMPINAVHLSFGTHMDVSEPDEEKRKKVIETVKDVFRRTEKFDNAFYVLHGSFEPILDAEREFHKTALIESLKELENCTDKTICLEDLPRSCMCNTADELIKVVDSCNKIAVCYDVNHLLHERTEDAALKIGKRIKTLHVSDYDYANERHWMPGVGKIDWNKLIGVFEKIGYQGAFNYEVNASGKEIKDNFNTLFENFRSQHEETYIGGEDEL